MKPQTIWLFTMAGLAIILLATAVLVQDHADAASRILAIVAIVVGAIVAAGPRFKSNGKEN